jgi:hypothetical protein
MAYNTALARHLADSGHDNPRSSWLSSDEEKSAFLTQSVHASQVFPVVDEMENGHRHGPIDLKQALDTVKSILFALIASSLPVLSGCSYFTSEDPAKNPATWVHATDSPEAEVKAAFVNIMRICQTKEVDVFRKLIRPQDVVEFDADEGEHPGSYEALMAAIISHPLKDYHLDATPARVVFTADPKAPKLGVYEKQAPTEVILVKEDNQWRIARSLNSDRSISTLDSIDPNSPAASSRTKSKRPVKSTTAH